MIRNFKGKKKQKKHDFSMHKKSKNNDFLKILNYISPQFISIYNNIFRVIRNSSDSVLLIYDFMFVKHVEY